MGNGKKKALCTISLLGKGGGRGPWLSGRTVSAAAVMVLVGQAGMWLGSGFKGPRACSSSSSSNAVSCLRQPIFFLPWCWNITCIRRSAYIQWLTKGREVGGVYPRVGTPDGALSVDHLKTIIELISLLFPPWKIFSAVIELNVYISQFGKHWPTEWNLSSLLWPTKNHVPRCLCTHAAPHTPQIQPYSMVLPELTNLFISSSLCCASFFTLNVYVQRPQVNTHQLPSLRSSISCSGKPHRHTLLSPCAQGNEAPPSLSALCILCTLPYLTLATLYYTLSVYPYHSMRPSTAMTLWH